MKSKTNMNRNFSFNNLSGPIDSAWFGISFFRASNNQFSSLLPNVIGTSGTVVIDYNPMRNSSFPAWIWPEVFKFSA